MSDNKKCPTVGGQAVIEGVMMKGTKYIATAVRRPTGEIVYRKRKILEDKLKFFKKPFLRGVLMLIESLAIGTKELTFSANQAGEEEEELTGFGLGMVLFTSFAIGIAVFFLLPAFVGGLVFKHNNGLANVLEGVLRLIIFVTYIYAVSFSKDIARVFQYHGAEHKTIYAFEKGEELTVENVKKHSTLHPRCGTSFLITVMIISIIIFSLADSQVMKVINVSENQIVKHLLKSVIRIGFLPVIASIAYEFQRYSSRHLDNFIIKALATPGLWLQRITTKEPDDEQLEVSITSLKAALGEENIENAKDITGEEKN
jgi:uncharacterized protein YqhQ